MDKNIKEKLSRQMEKDGESDLESKVESLELEVDQLKDAVEFYKKKAEEESPAALHAELHRLQRAARTALGIIQHAERRSPSRPSSNSSGNRYTRVAMAMKGRPGGHRPGGTLAMVAKCLVSALDNKPPRKVIEDKKGGGDEKGRKSLQ